MSDRESSEQRHHDSPATAEDLSQLTDRRLTVLGEERFDLRRGLCHGRSAQDKLARDFKDLAAFDQELERSLRRGIGCELLPRRRLERLRGKGLTQRRTGCSKRLRQLRAMRRTLDVRAGPGEALFAHGRNQRIEHLIDRKFVRDRVAEVGQRQTLTLRVLAVKVVDELRRTPRARPSTLPHRPTDHRP